jgi:hypothetical protein
MSLSRRSTPNAPLFTGTTQLRGTRYPVRRGLPARGIQSRCGTGILAAVGAGASGADSPVQVFWGALDLACTRSRGGPPPCIREEPPTARTGLWPRDIRASSCGSWPGGGKEGAFYSYAYPEPDGFRAHPVEPDTACFSEESNEFLLLTKPCALQMIPTARSRGSFRPLTRRLPISATGTAMLLKTIRTICRHSPPPKLACALRSSARK